jgi:cytochrome c oxidase subunit IV
MATDTQHGTDTEHGNHPSVGQYVEIGVILAVLTAIEVALFFADVPREVTIPALLFLTAMKFILVVAWFMHLRFDHRIFRRLFIGGALLAGVLFAILILIQFTSPIVTQV